MKKRVLSLIMVLTMLISVAANVFAAGNTGDTEKITVYLSISDNGDFVNSPVTGDKMAKIPVEISYFDLGDMGLEAFYKYDAEGQTVIQSPTLLHLFIQTIEDYYLDEAYNTEDTDDTNVLKITGSAGSASLERFWNHDYNLMYKIDRANAETVDNPYATCDTLLLENGDVITVGMFTSTTWYQDGYFAYFDNYTANVTEDADVSFTVKGRPVFGDGTTDVALSGEKVFAVKTTKRDWLTDETLELFESIDKNGTFEITFNKPGTYYITLLDCNVSTNTATIIPDIVTVTVNEAPALPKYSGDWMSFRGNAENMGIVSLSTPEKAANTKLKWAQQHSASWEEPITSPILVNGDLYIGKTNTVLKISAATGEVVTTGAKLEGDIGYGTIAPTYGGGMIFIPVGNGRIQALRADTLESVWVSEALGGQILTPITYKDGKVYCGTWTSETADGKYFCLDAEDENKAKKTETKSCEWTVSHSGGFYGAGAYVGDGFVIFGSDNGTEDNGGNATLYSINTKTGNEIARLNDFAGDIRTSIAYDAETESVYFATKNNKFYKVLLNNDGSFGTAESLDLDGMSTATPIVYNGIAYVSVASPDGAWAKTGHKYLGIDVEASPMTVKAECDVPGYAQGSAILSSAYEQTTGKLYLYTTYNNNPGGIYLIEISDSGEDESRVITLQGSDLYVPESTLQNYCASSLVCDSEGTIYHKNDSGYLMALKREVVTTTPSHNPSGNVSIDGGGNGSKDEKTEEDEKDNADEENNDFTEDSNAELIKFADIQDHWAFKYISALIKKGIIKGKSETEFAPDDYISRAEFVTLLYRIGGKAVELSGNFTDVNDGDWFAEAVAWAYAAGITSGVSETSFAPDECITREQAATFIVRFAEYINCILTEAAEAAEFADAESVSEWAKNSVKLMQAAGIISGKENNMFAPNDETTRAETAKMLILMMEIAKLL